MMNINNPQFAYFMGYFVADGCYYKSGRGNRFEFSDGSSIKKELYYSKEFLEKIRKLIKNIFNIDTPQLRKRENKYVLHFRNKFVESILKKNFNLKPWKKTLSIKVPNIYRNNKFFWIGLMDGDGMVARESRKVALSMVNINIINDFKRFLMKNGIEYKYREDYPTGFAYKTNNKRYTVTICGAFFNKYASEIGFLHPRKRLWMLHHLNKKSGFVHNTIINHKINYLKLFNKDNIFIENGKEIFKKFGINHSGRRNKKLVSIFNRLKNFGMTNREILNLLLRYRFKLSKGSKNSIKLPRTINKNILEIARFIRLRNGSVGISKMYIRSHNKDPNKIVNKFEKIFDIKPKYTKRNELVYCSGILNMLFSSLIERDNKLYKMPDFSKVIF